MLMNLGFSAVFCGVTEDMGAYGVDIGSNIGELLLRLSDALPPNVTQHS